MSDPVHGWATRTDGTRVKLTEAECADIWRRADEAKTKRATDMPDEQAALRTLTDAFQRLRELGWSEAMYCPKDGSLFDVIEAGSSGIHRCYYQGEWPTGSWWVVADGDAWPSDPILYRPDPAVEAERRERMKAVIAQIHAGEVIELIEPAPGYTPCPNRECAYNADFWMERDNCCDPLCPMTAHGHGCRVGGV